MSEVIRYTWSGKRALPKNPACSQYVALGADNGVRLTLHDSAGFPGNYWLNSTNHAGDYRPMRLDLEQVRALRDGCERILADHDNQQSDATNETGRAG